MLSEYNEKLKDKISLADHMADIFIVKTPDINVVTVDLLKKDHQR